MQQNKLLGGLILGLPLALVIGIMMFLAQVAEEEAAACDFGLVGNGLPAVAVDPASVPQGPIAGYGHRQLVNAAHIMMAARDLDLSRRDQQIGLMTAMGESGLEVLDHGDKAGPDSRGLFQQRANGKWGSLADRMDPYISATNFFNALREVPERGTLEPTIAAHRVQGNADPYHYRRYWSAAQQIASALSGIQAVAPVGLTTPPSSTYDLGPVQPQLADLVNVLGPKFGITAVGGYRKSAADPAGHPAGLAADFMVPTTPAGKAQGDALAAYAVAHAAELKVDYVLWQQQIWSAGRAAEGWRPMKDRGSATANHVDHVHINALPDGTVPTSNTSSVSQVAAQACSGVLVSSSSWIVPLDAPVTSPYGPRTNPHTGKPSFHDGIDYGAACGTPIKAASSGLVVAAGESTIYGHQIVVDHGGGIITKYGHMHASGLLVRPGDQVATGDVIALVGSDGWSTGCHLHFTVEVNGQHTDPVAFLANPPAPVGIGDGVSVAQANIKADLNAGDFAADLAATVARGPDFVSLNEVASRPDAALAAPGYAAFRAPGGNTQARSSAVAWRSDRWQLVDGGRQLLVDNGPQVWDAGRSATWATVQNTDGGRASIVSVHHMINPAKFGPNRAERQRLYAEGMRRLQALASSLSAAGPVFVAGDFNSQYGANDAWGPRTMLGAIGMSSTFDVHGAVPTHDGGGTIDYLFFLPDQATATSQSTRNLKSDHHALIAAFAGAS